MIMKELTPTMKKALTLIRSCSGWWCGNLGVGRSTMAALYNRGLIRFEKRIDKKAAGGPRERTFAIPVE